MILIYALFGSGILLNQILFNKQMKKIDWFPILLLVLWQMSCSSSNDPQTIIDQVIENHGGQRYENFTAEFDFRGRHYVITHKNGDFQYERHFEQDSSSIKDILNNQGFKRFLNEEDITDTVRKADAYARSVNSVAYFALLPYPLNDPAVKKTYLGTGEVKGASYHKILVTFEQEGGGEDYQDEFVYWVHTQTMTMEYLAYLYYTDGGGKRFRAPLKSRTVGGIRFTDYENYQEPDETMDIVYFDQQYDQGKLKLLSVIELENLKVGIPE